MQDDEIQIYNKLSKIYSFINLLDQLHATKFHMLGAKKTGACRYEGFCANFLFLTSEGFSANFFIHILLVMDPWQSQTHLFQHVSQ